MKMIAGETGYQPNWLVGMLHSMPHLDFSLELVNSTFNFENLKYKEVVKICVAFNFSEVF